VFSDVDSRGGSPEFWEKVWKGAGDVRKQLGCSCTRQLDQNSGCGGASYPAPWVDHLDRGTSIAHTSQLELGTVLYLCFIFTTENTLFDTCHCEHEENISPTKPV